MSELKLSGYSAKLKREKEKKLTMKYITSAVNGSLILS